MENDCKCGKMRCNNTGGWNYRFVEDSSTSYPEEPSFAVYEVHYKDGEISGWSENQMHPRGDSPAQLLADLCLMQKAFYAPMLRLVKDGDNEKLVDIEPLNRVTGRPK